ncbi:MAG TPA: hypothetical protein VG738_14395 [Chitinophagaceae bacterium]|nr:hypothetical protein [Chitinophagaceae bacterium]
MSNQFVQKAVNVSVSIRGCKCTEFSLSTFAIENKQIIPFDKYKFDFNLTIKVDGLQKHISIEINSTLSANSDSIQGLLAELKSIHTFLVTNFDEIAIKTDQGMAVPEQALPPLLGMAFSNIRGMFSVKLENTIYENAILPIVDANKMLPQKAPMLG